jgi:hypothetical protein
MDTFLPPKAKVALERPSDECGLETDAGCIYLWIQINRMYFFFTFATIMCVRSLE